ncbi:diguanylate cyclase [Yoonia sp. R2331]|uniref:GGDEF domain-containing protein n=1 Tax=Yoonia sp. R2331 TaxID=3237238 RepID=UPI0034E38A9F
MANLLSTLTIFLQPIALTVSLVYAYGAIGRWRRTERVRNLSLGVLFGIGTVISMHAPLTLAEGMIFDLRNLMVGVAFAFLGPLAGAITLVFGVATRLLIGGPGAMIGIIAMSVSAGMALIWFLNQRNKTNYSHTALGLLGVMISAHILVGLFLPPPFRDVFLRDLAPIILVANIVCTWGLGKMIMREHLLRTELSDLRTAAETDPLTNLLNRRSLVKMVDRLHLSVAERDGSVLLYFDIDRFKAINDQFGHLIGDKVLQFISQRVKSCLRPEDIFARLGGDEFVVVLPNVTPGIAEIVAERCRHAVCREPIVIDGVLIDASISMGATYCDRPTNFDTLLRAADDALYAAKDDGRNRISLDASFANVKAQAA